MSRPLRILHVCPRPSFSGLEAYAFAMAEAQAKLGHQISFVTLSGSPLEEKVSGAGFPAHSIGTGPMAKPTFTFRLMGLLTGKDKPDIVHLHSTQDINMFLPALLLSRAAGGARPKIVLQIHIWISHSKRDPLHALAYTLIDEVWCSSEPARKTLERYLPVDPKKLRIVRYGREIERIRSGLLERSEARLKLGIPGSAIVIGAVARIDEGKGTKELLDAAIPILEARPDLALVWIGPPTSDDPKAVRFGEEVLSRVSSLPANLKSRVLFPGSIPDSYRLLKAFDLFVLPSYSECFALSLLEAQLAGLPTLGTNAGGTPEVVRPGQTGWLFEPRSALSCREAILEALNHRESWSQYGRAASVEVAERYDFNRILPETILAYESLLT